MPMNIDWLDAEQTMLCATGEGRWTWDEFHEGVQEIVKRIKSVPHRVDLIYNHTPNSRPPSGSPMPHYKYALQVMPPNAGMHVIVSINLVSRTLLNVFLKVYGKSKDAKFALVGSLDEAKQVIAAEREAQGELVNGL